jgi:Tol biopolymer transport system component
MKSTCRFIALALLLVLGPGSTFAQSGYDLFQKALVKERSEGKLDEAIQLYKQIAREHAADRALTAKALVQMGQCYEKLGNVEAQKAYERVVREYSDQPEAATARTRLAALAQPRLAASASAVLARRVTDDGTLDQLGTPSPDGRFLSTTDWGTGDLAVIDIATGQKRRVTNKGSWTDSSEFAMFSAVSPDGKRIAYGWYNKQEKFDLRVIDADGASPHVLYSSEAVELPWPTAWSPDGNFVLALLARRDRTGRIALISVTDGAVRVLKTLARGNASFKASISPDGRYIAYDYLAKEDAPEHDIFLLSVEGGREVPLVRHAADDLLPVWTPDGQSVVFVSDRTGNLGLWRIRVSGGKPQGPEELLKQDVGRLIPIGFSSKGSYYYGLDTGLTDVYLAGLDLATGKATSAPVPLSQRYIGDRSSPHWSPDGKYLVSVSRRGPFPQGMGSHILSIFSVETGKERELLINLENVRRPQWSPDSREILVNAIDAQGRQGLFRVDARSGDATLVGLTEPETTFTWGMWSRDGKSVLFLRGDTKKRTTSLVQHNLQTREEKELYRTAPPLGFNSFELSPDGREVVLNLIERSTSNVTFRIIPIAGGEPRDLYQAQGPSGIRGNTRPVWTPDGKGILFLRLVPQAQPSPGTQPMIELWRVSVENGKAEKLDLSMEGMRELTLHPDGKRFAFAAGQTRTEIWVMENLIPASPRAAK